MLKNAIKNWKWIKDIKISSLNALYKEFTKDNTIPRSDIVQMIITKINDGSDAQELNDSIECDYKDRNGKFY